MSDYKVISVVGNSIAQGFFDHGNAGWPARLLARLQLREPYQWYLRNFAVSGDQTVDALFRMRQNVASNPGNILLVACGVNDILRYKDPESAPQVGPDVCAYRWKQLLTEAKRLPVKTIVVGMIPVDEAKQEDETRLTLAGERFFNFNTDIAAYNAQIADLCRKFGIDFTPLFDGMMQAGHEAMLHNSSHPNERGHDWIAGQVFNYFQAAGL